MAAVDGIVIAQSSIAAAASLTIQPTGTEEWMIRNIWYGGAVELYRTDGSNAVKITSDTVASQIPVCLHITNAIYLTVKNVSAGSLIIGYDGLRTA